MNGTFQERQSSTRSYEYTYVHIFHEGNGAFHTCNASTGKILLVLFNCNSMELVEALCIWFMCVDLAFIAYNKNKKSIVHKKYTGFLTSVLRTLAKN